MAFPPVIPLRRRLIAIGVLVLWAAPGAGALAVGLHVTFGHRHGSDHHGDDHSAAALELALAAVHGHRHDLEATPDHEHSAALAGGPSVHAGPPMPADLPSNDPVRCLPGLAVERPSPARHGPVTSLFAAHCSLLL